MRLKDKVVIITGGGSGMGKASSELFASEGAKVVIADYQEVYKRAVGQETADAIVESGFEAIYIETDISDEKSVEELVEKTISKYGRIDVLYNNASHGYSSPYVMADVINTPLDAWNKVIAVNLTGMYLCCKHVLPHMIKQNRGSIINCASTNALVAMPGADAYTAAKGGVLALTRVLSSDHAAQQIRVNCICPGGTKTPMVMGALTNPDVLKAAEAAIPLGRMAEPIDIAYTALFLASDESLYLTGIVIPVDGGWTAR